MRKFIFNLSFLAMGILAYAQPADSVQTKEAKDYRPSFIMVGYNVVPLVNSIFFEAKTAQEAQVGIDFANNLLMVDIGVQKTARSDASYNYQNNGSYFRAGIETNVLDNNARGNNLTFGLKYARSRFSDQLEIASRDYGFGEESVSRSNTTVKSRWWEATMGLNVQVVGQLYFGYVIRYKIYKKNRGLEGLDPYDLPGFGRNENKSTVGFDYYVRWMIPVRKEEVPKE